MLPRLLTEACPRRDGGRRRPHPPHRVAPKPLRARSVGHAWVCSRGQQRSTLVSYGPLGLAAHLRERCHPGPGRAACCLWHARGQGVQIPSAPPGTTHRQVGRSGSLPEICQSLTSRVRRNTLSAGRFGGFEAFHDESCPEDFYSASTPATGHLPHPHTRVDPKESRRPPRQRVGNGPGIGNAQRNSGLRTGWEIGADDRCRGHADTSGDHRDHHHCDDLPVVVVARV
jgi:hypothetical protein